jgi:hypothetical protein
VDREAGNLFDNATRHAGLSAALLAAAISGLVSIFGVIVSYLLSKWKEREADWRKVKLDLYKEYINAVAGIPEGRMTPESEVRYHDAFNTIGLVASPAVIAAVQAFQAEISPANTARTQASHDEKYSNLVNALREDLMGRRRRKGSDSNFYMISTRPWSGSTNPIPK